MHFPVCIALLLVCSTLLEAVPSPQINSAQKQRWRPKAVREKEAAEAAAAAKAAEEAVRAAEEAARTSTTTQVTTQVVEDITEIVQEAETKEITVGVEEVEEETISATTVVTDEPIETNVIVVTTTTTQKNIVKNSASSEMANLTANNTEENEMIKIRVSTDDDVNKATQAPLTPVPAVENFCRLSLRGKSCTCRFEKTCRCDCGRIFSADNQHSPVKSAVNSNRGKNSRIRIQRFQFPKSNKH